MKEWPDWSDCGMEVYRVKDRGKPPGRLQCEAFFTGEEEIPVFSVLVDGAVVPFIDETEWEYVRVREVK